MRTVVAVAVAVVLLPRPAAGGGIETLELDDDLAVEVDYLVRGDVVTGTAVTGSTSG